MVMGPTPPEVKNDKRVQVQIGTHYNLMRKSGGKSDGTLYKELGPQSANFLVSDIFLISRMFLKSHENYYCSIPTH